MRHAWVLILGGSIVAACSGSRDAADGERLRQEVLETERAFARTMADRDIDGFSAFLAEEAVFYSGEEPLVGRDVVTAAWSGYFEGPDPPFSWEPGTVVVLESGSLALSTGPVYDRDGRVVATFTSIWRREAPGEWRVVFDRGCETCATGDP